jgi:N-acetylglucosamine kinase-like BadF-type ATPase
MSVLASLFEDARTQAKLDGRIVDVALLCMAGVDFPREEERLADLVGARGWAAGTTVLNDTFAVLRAGTEEGWGVAVVCGSGINCVGVAPDGRQVRFPALGPITGDWGGGSDVGLAAMSSAARSFDGRGPKTTLERAVPTHFGFETPYELAEAIHAKRIEERRLLELSPVVFAEAEHDDVAAAIVDRLATEVVALAGVALERLGLDEVLLGGGLLQGEDSRVVERIRGGLPSVTVRVTGAPPIVGAALLGLDQVGADAEAQARVRAELAEVVDG